MSFTKRVGIKISSRSGPEVIKLVFLFNSADHVIFPATKYENANNRWHFHIYQQIIFHAQLCLARFQVFATVSKLRFIHVISSTKLMLS